MSYLLFYHVNPKLCAIWFTQWVFSKGVFHVIGYVVDWQCVIRHA